MYIAIIDYGIGNIKSVENAFKKISADVRVTDNIRIINNAHALVLPGVGAIRDARRNLEELKILKKDSKLFSGIKEGEYFYFDHSYHAVPDDKGIISCTTDYGIQLTAGIEYDNIYGVQFHPEKSSNYGLKLLENFRDMVKEEGQR